MVLNELGQKISAALAKVQNAEVVDDALLDLCLKDISTALLQADVNVKQVSSPFFALQDIASAYRHSYCKDTAFEQEGKEIYHPQIPLFFESCIFSTS